MKTFNDLSVGESAEFKHTISQEDVSRFAELTGDDNPLHINRNFAEKTSFKGIVAHGMLGASFLSTIIGKYLPGPGALWVSQSMNFILPVRIGDVLRVKATVVKKSETSKLVTLKTEIFNQYSQVVLEGESQVKVIETKSEVGKATIDNPNKVVLITGASRGIGAATAILLAKKGYQVGINYCSDEEGARNVLEVIQASGGDGILCKGDISQESQVDKVVSRLTSKYGTVTALVNNASGKIISQSIENLNWVDIQRHIDVQVKGAFLTSKAVLREFQKWKYGAIVNIGSIVSDGAPPARWAAYVLAKAALYSLTKSLALELGPRGIRVNLVSPGMTDTLLISEIPERARLLVEHQTPMKRLARPEDVAATISFLLSEDASFLTGQSIRVCGGQVMI